jgi:predicted RNA-binding Zn ribbon-like protein
MAEKKVKAMALPARFELLAGNVALDFINTLDNRPSAEPTELLADYRELVNFAQQSKIISADDADYLRRQVSHRPRDAEAALRETHKLREALHEIVSALMKKRNAPKAAMDAMNAGLHQAALHSRLAQVHGGCELQFDSTTSSFRSMMWPIAQAAAALLTSSDITMVRACSSPTCQWLFLDTSRNHHRRWCSMKLCGNRTKVRRFYAKKKGGWEANEDDHSSS